MEERGTIGEIGRQKLGRKQKKNTFEIQMMTSTLEGGNTHTHTHVNIFSGGYNEAVKMKNEVVKSNNRRSYANFSCRTVEGSGSCADEQADETSSCNIDPRSALEFTDERESTNTPIDWPSRQLAAVQSTDVEP